MMQTVEAEVDVNGNVRLLEPLCLTKTGKAIVTLLEENGRQKSGKSVENIRQVLEFMQSSEFKNRKSYSSEEIEAQIEENRN